MRARPSTWPETRCPPSRSDSRRAFSRLTTSPSRNAPSVTRANVSFETSKASVAPSRSTTVRQQPETAMLSPIATSEKSSPGASMANRKSPPRGSLRASVPTASMSPVNIAFLEKCAAKDGRFLIFAIRMIALINPKQQQPVLTDAALIDYTQGVPLHHAFQRPQRQRRTRAVAQQHRRNIEQQFVHQPGFEQRATQARPGFHLQLVHLLLCEQSHDRMQIELAVRIEVDRREFRLCVAAIGWLRIRR